MRVVLSDMQAKQFAIEHLKANTMIVLTFVSVKTNIRY